MPTGRLSLRIFVQMNIHPLTCEQGLNCYAFSAKVMAQGKIERLENLMCYCFVSENVFSHGIM